MFIIYNHKFKESSIVDSQQQMFTLAVANLQLTLRITSCESTFYGPLLFKVLPYALRILKIKIKPLLQNMASPHLNHANYA